jgi:hypothetical protein
MSGCATQALPASGDIPKTPSELQPTPISEALFQVVLPDGSAIGFTWDDLKELPLGQVTAEGKTEEGPKIQDVLQAAGVSDYQQITLTGVNGSLTMSRNQVDEGAVLDFTNHGTVKLSATSVPKDKWIKDITEISVE